MCTKTCSKCGETKDVSEFRKRRLVCKKCVYKQDREYNLNYCKTHYQENKESRKAASSLYYNINKEELLKKNKERYEKNKESVKVKQKEYYIKNKDKIIKRVSEYAQEHKEEKASYLKNYVEQNRDVINKRLVERTKTDPLFRVQKLVRNRIQKVLQKNKIPKNSPTEQIIGCTYEELVRHLEDNRYGFTITEKGLDIDHIIPIHTATTEEEVIRLNHYTNLQLLPSTYNRDIKKGGAWNPEHFHRYYFNSI